MSHPSRFSPEQRARAAVAEARPNYPSEWAAICSVAAKLGASAETVRKWIRQAATDAGSRSGLDTEESGEIKRLRRENAELRRANEILKAAAAFFAAELDRPPPRAYRGPEHGKAPSATETALEAVPVAARRCSPRW